MEQSTEKVVNKIILLCCFWFVFSPKTILAEENYDLHFIAIGHTYSTLKDSITRDNYIRKVNQENADYVFILGDSQLNDSLVVFEYQSKINAKTFFTPGNHEITSRTINGYTKTVGYSDTTIIDDKCNFIVLNSLAMIQNINKYLKKAFKKINFDNPVIILTHHRIWDENLMSDKSYEHDKSYNYDEIDSFFRSKINYIFAGNSSAQYFGQQYCLEHKTNKNVTFWSDAVNQTICYSVGMKYNQHFTNAVLNKNKLLVYPSIIKKTSFVKDVDSKLKIPIKKTNFLKKIVFQLKRKSLWFAFFMGVLSSYIIYKIKRK